MQLNSSFVIIFKLSKLLFIVFTIFEIVFNHFKANLKHVVPLSVYFIL